VRKAAERRLAAWAVPGGVAQLILLKWMEGRYPESTVKAVSGVVFLLYIGGVLWLLRRVVKAR
jgi:hypothetical protein